MPYQLRPLEYRQMFGDSRLGHARIASQCVNGLFALPAQLLKNSPARRIGKSAEHGIGVGRLHTTNHNHMAMVCQERGRTFSRCCLASTPSIVWQTEHFTAQSQAFSASSAGFPASRWQKARLKPEP